MSMTTTCVHADGSAHVLEPDADGMFTSCGFGSAPLPDLDDEPVTLPVLAEMVEEASDLIDALVDLAAVLRHVEDPSTHLSLRIAGDDLGQAWAHARRALMTLRDVVVVTPPTT